MKRALMGIVLGLSLGLITSIFFAFIFGDGNYHPVSPASHFGEIYLEKFSDIQIMIIAALLWSAIGLMFSLGTYIFTHTDFSEFVKTLIHFMTMLFIFFPLALLAGWFPLKLSALIIFIVIFIIVYIIIWSIVNAITRKRINEINRNLRR